MSFTMRRSSFIDMASPKRDATYSFLNRFKITVQHFDFILKNFFMSTNSERRSETICHFEFTHCIFCHHSKPLVKGPIQKVGNENQSLLRRWIYQMFDISLKISRHPYPDTQI